MYVKFDTLLLDEIYYPRNTVHWQAVERYKAALKAGQQMPPLVVGKRGGRWVILDGWHRYRAYEKLHADKVSVLATREPENRWYLEAVRLNAQHGMALTYQERVGAAMRLQKEGIGEAEIIGVLGVPIDDIKKAIAQRGHWMRPEDVKPIVAKSTVARSLKKRGQTLDQQSDAAVAEIERQQKIFVNVSAQKNISEAIAVFELDVLSKDEKTKLLVQRLHQLVTQWLAAP